MVSHNSPESRLEACISMSFYGWLLPIFGISMRAPGTCITVDSSISNMFCLLVFIHIAYHKRMYTRIPFVCVIILSTKTNGAIDWLSQTMNLNHNASKQVYKDLFIIPALICGSVVVCSMWANASDLHNFEVHVVCCELTAYWMEDRTKCRRKMTNISCGMFIIDRIFVSGIAATAKVKCAQTDVRKCMNAQWNFEFFSEGIGEVLPHSITGRWCEYHYSSRIIQDVFEKPTGLRLWRSIVGNNY